MSDLLTTLEAPYTSINRALSQVRETFHKRGRIADANAKLDETVKLMAVHHAYISRYLVGERYEPLTRRDSFSIAGLNEALRISASAPFFVGSNGKSLFGQNPAVAFEDDEGDLAFELFNAAGVAISAQAMAEDSLDVVNEAFGHHVRDNFRSNTEDAQYMTPPEVVDFMVSLAQRFVEPNKKPLVVVDPSCGVGSFLVAWHREQQRDSVEHDDDSPVVIGQDKVDRMARLAKANLVFSGFASDRIFVGSSLEDDTPLSQFDGQVDLILTNPPFGARFSAEEISASSRRSLPQFAARKAGGAVDSELLFMERYLTLLRPNGVCIVVVPDGVISGKGAASVARQMLVRSAELLAVIELPPVTFAQAGTRTKTAILAFRKVDNPRHQLPVFLAEVQDLGFNVSKRKGVALKRSMGTNELPAILTGISSVEKPIALDSGGFAEWHVIEPGREPAWTPRRFRNLQESADGLPDNVEFKSRPLAEVVKQRKRVRAQSYSPGTLFISVLHVIGEGMLDLPSVQTYRPITPGVPVEPGSVIISRINPRIPRVLVVPDLGSPMLCSSEFEVLEPIDGVSPYALAFLLLSAPAQQQIRSLTAGTSASHSRVHPDAIRAVSIPWPSSNEKAFERIIGAYENANRAIISAIAKISSLRAG